MSWLRSTGIGCVPPERARPPHGDECAGRARRRRARCRATRLSAARRPGGLHPGRGRGVRRLIAVAGGIGSAARRELQRQSRLDARGPGGAAAAAGETPGRGARRHAGTRRCRPRGTSRPRRRCCRRRRSPVRLRAADGELFDRGAGADAWCARPDSAALAPLVARALAPGDAILIKGSLGSRMKPWSTRSISACEAA